MIKSKRTILEIVGGTLCITLGILAGRVTMVVAQDSSKITQSETVGQLAVGKQAAKIAVVNLDAGIEKNKQQIYYASKIIEYPNENYQTTSLEEAKTGIESGQYGAYVIIPSTFSASVDSINGTPEKAVFEYEISSSLSAEEREKIIYEVSQFEKSVSTNVAYVYIDAILSEVHSVQDGASTILANDDSEKESLLSISAEDLIETVEFSELKENNDTVKPVDLKEESLNLEKAVQRIEMDFDGWLEQGQTDYTEVVSANKEMEQALKNFENSIQNTNPLINEKGEYSIAEGISNVNGEIDAYNAMIEAKRPLLNDSIVSEVNLYAQQNQLLLETWKQEVQKSINTQVVVEMQQQLNKELEDVAIENEILANQQSQEIQNQITEYTADLQVYLNTSLSSQAVKESIKSIAQLQAENALENAKVSYIEYGENCAKREVTQEYNELLVKNNSEIEELQEALKELDEVSCALEEAKTEKANGINVNEEELQKTYQQTLEVVLEKANKVQLVNMPNAPAEMDEPEVSISINENEIDMTLIQDAADLSKAVDEENNQIKQPEVTVYIPTPSISLTQNAIKYQVPEFQLPQASPIKEETLKGIEEYYDVPKDKIADVFEEEVVNVIEERNSELQMDVEEKISVFYDKQGSYQTQLDSFNPFVYVDSSKIAENISNISENIAGIETEINERGTEYLQYTADVFTTANENINILKEDMMKANEETRKRVIDQISALKSSRTEINQENASILENFSKKLSFTRVGDLPYREAYEFIVSPIEYQQSDK